MNICQCPCHVEHRAGDDDYPHTDYCNAWRRDVNDEFANYWQALTLPERAELRRKMGQPS